MELVQGVMLLKDHSKTSISEGGWDVKCGTKPDPSTQKVLWSCSRWVVLTGFCFSDCQPAHPHMCMSAYVLMCSCKRQTGGGDTTSVIDCDTHTGVWPWSTPTLSTWSMQWLQSILRGKIDFPPPKVLFHIAPKVLWNAPGMHQYW